MQQIEITILNILFSNTIFLLNGLNNNIKISYGNF